MKTLICIINLFILSLGSSLQAQIYADFTVSHPELSGGGGVFRVRLDYDKAPRVCANFIGLATGQKAWLDTKTGRVATGVKYYDGLTFHRLMHNFMIQGGDPQGDGYGGPGYVFQDQFHPDLRHSGKYIISMANSGPNSNGSQFFIMLNSASNLDDKHSVFGGVINDTTYPDGTGLIDEFTNAANFPTSGQPSDLLNTPVTITSVELSGPSLAGFNINNPAWLLPTVNGVETKVAHDPDADSYTATWDRKVQAEYVPSFSFELSSWLFVTSRKYLLSMDAAVDFQETVTGITGDRLFSRVVEVDYSLMFNAPGDLVAAGKVVVITIADGETVSMTFNGSGGGSWTHSSGESGSLSNVDWSDAAPVAGMFSYSQSQAKYIPLGGLKVTFDTPVGSERWDSFDFEINFHTPTGGWCSGSAEVPDGEVELNERLVPFSYTP